MIAHAAIRQIIHRQYRSGISLSGRRIGGLRIFHLNPIRGRHEWPARQRPGPSWGPSDSKCCGMERDRCAIATSFRNPHGYGAAQERARCCGTHCRSSAARHPEYSHPDNRWSRALLCTEGGVSSLRPFQPTGVPSAELSRGRGQAIQTDHSAIAWSQISGLVACNQLIMPLESLGWQPAHLLMVS